MKVYLYWFVYFAVILTAIITCEDKQLTECQQKYDSLLVEYESKMNDTKYLRSIIDTMFVTMPECKKEVLVTDTTYYLTVITGANHIFFSDTVAYFLRVYKPLDSLYTDIILRYLTK